MQETVQKIFTEGKGILASDAREKGMSKRLFDHGIEGTKENALKFREILYTTPGIEEFISGVILNDDTVRSTMHGKTPIQILNEKGILPGIKVDGGTEGFNGTEEVVTIGLDGLEERLSEYSKMGLVFSKWRGVFMINDKYPSDAFFEENLTRMAKYAKLSQKYNIVPIVEPEVLLDGNHTTTRSSETIDETLKILFEKLDQEKVDINNLILKTSMALPGPVSGVKALPLEVANATLRALKKSVPPEVSGIVFLSGGQTANEATANLNEIEKLKGDALWPVSFSFERALQEDAMIAWAGKEENIKLAQDVFLTRAKKVSTAQKGEL